MLLIKAPEWVESYALCRKGGICDCQATRQGKNLFFFPLLLVRCDYQNAFITGFKNKITFYIHSYSF